MFNLYYILKQNAFIEKKVRNKYDTLYKKI